MTSRHKTPTVSSTAPAVSALANHTGIKSPTQIMKERQDRERRRAEQKEHDSMLRDQEKRRQVAAEKELGLEEEARRRSAERRAAAAAGGPHSQPQPSQSQQPYMSAAGGSSQQPPATPRSRHNHNHSHSHSNGANPADTTIKKTPISGSNSKASFPHAFERWETLSAQWEGLTRHWIRRLEMNGAMLDTDPLSKTLSRQVTDLSAAGANLFHAVVELQRLRASSERKFQRWFFETRGELERLQEDKAQLEAALRDEQNNRRETTAQVQNTETVNLLQRQLAEMKKELTISKEEARRAWEELGRREHEERERTFSLQNGQPTIVGGVQVVPMGTGGGRRDAAHNGQPGASYTPPHQPPAGSGISYVTDGSAYQSAYVLDAAGNEVLDAHGRPIPYQTTGSPLQSHPDMDDYDLPSSRSHHHYQSMSSPSAAAGPSGAGAGSSAGASSSAPSSSIPATAGASAPAQYNSAVAWDMADAKHQHPTRLSDVLEEEESRTTGSHVGRS